MVMQDVEREWEERTHGIHPPTMQAHVQDHQNALKQQAHDQGQTLVATTSAALGKYIGNSKCFVLGESKEAARGICDLLGIDRMREGHILQHPIRSMREEFQAIGGAIYAVFVEHNRTPLLNKLKKKTAANLESHHVLALRLYTTNLFTEINDPLRQCSRPHPLASTVSEATKPTYFNWLD